MNAATYVVYGKIVSDSQSGFKVFSRRALEVMDLQPDLRYQERPIRILDTASRKTRTSETRICRVQWSNHTEAEATWEKEDDLRREFPYLFEELSESRGRDSR